MTIREEVSKKLGYTITQSENGANWDEAFESLQVEGRLDNRALWDIILILLKREEKHENG